MHIYIYIYVHIYIYIYIHIRAARAIETPILRHDRLKLQGRRPGFEALGIYSRCLQRGSPNNSCLPKASQPD